MNRVAFYIGLLAALLWLLSAVLEWFGGAPFEDGDKLMFIWLLVLAIWLKD